MSQLQQPPSSETIDPVPPTDFGTFVVDVLARTTSSGARPIDQKALRQCIGLASSFLITDTTINPQTGTDTWYIGFSRLVDIIVALHARSELELETFNTASKACSECWMVAGSWRGLADCRNGIKDIASKLKKILDSNGRTYRGDAVYSP